MICEQSFTENILKIIDKLNDFFLYYDYTKEIQL